MKNVIILFLLALCLAACKSGKNKFDASGTFEAVETMISAEVTGTIKELKLDEGQVLNENEYVGYIDSLQLYLKRKQLQAQIKALLSKRPDIAVQIAAIQEQIKQAEHEQKRVTELLKADAATQKQWDDINSQIAILNKQREALESNLGISSGSINEEATPLGIQIEQLSDQLQKCRLVNPVKGTVLPKYAEKNEVAIAGKPLYKIADLSTIILRAYVTGDQLSQIKLNQPVTVFVDSSEGNYKEYAGVLEWISDKAEFTPKTIQTKEERANLVYAVKVKVNNYALLKIGAYGEVKF